MDAFRDMYGRFTREEEGGKRVYYSLHSLVELELAAIRETEAYNAMRIAKEKFWFEPVEGKRCDIPFPQSVLDLERASIDAIDAWGKARDKYMEDVNTLIRFEERVDCAFSDTERAMWAELLAEKRRELYLIVNID